MTYLEQHKNEIFKKFTDEELLKDIDNYKNGKGKLNKVLNHFFEECIFNCKGGRGAKTPLEALQDEQSMNRILEAIKKSPNLYYSEDEIVNVKKFFSMAGRIAQKVANFCPQNAKNIYFRYFPNALTDTRNKLNVLDTSCGFGSRMSAVLLNGHNYYGFDPNIDLQKQLIKCAKFYKSHNLIDNAQKCTLYSSGSEQFRSELENTIDVSFTSPPYFNLERYYDDNSASTINYNDYQAWLNEFVKPTIENTYKYLKVGGYAMINIKNLTTKGKQKLFDDWFDLFQSIKGFEFVETFDMKHQHKRTFNGKHATISDEEYLGFKEPVMVFRKTN